MKLHVDVALEDVPDEGDEVGRRILNELSGPNRPAWYSQHSVYTTYWSSTKTDSRLFLYGEIEGNPWGTNAERAALEAVIEGIKQSILDASGDPHLLMTIYFRPVN